MKLKLFLLILSLIGSTFSNAQSNKYLKLDGVNDFMEVADHSDLDIDGSENFTITTWVKSSTTDDYYRIVDKRATDGTGYEMFLNNSNGTYGLNLESTSGTNSGPPYSTTSMTDGNWHHLAFVVDRNAASSRIYIDGAFEGVKSLSSIATASFANAVNLVIGKDLSTNSRHFQGDIDEFRIWSKAMTVAELISDMTTTVSGTESNLLAAWNFENVSGTSVPDLTGSGHTGTLNGGALIIDPSLPMEVSTVELEPQTTLPVGQGNQNERVVALNVQTIGGLNSLTATALNMNLAGTTSGNISNIKVYYTGGNANLETTTLFGSASPASGTIVVSGSQTLALGNNYFWLTYDISSAAIEGEIIDAAVESVTVGGVVEPLSITNVAGSRLILLEHKNLWSGGDYGSVNYRIPAICTALDGTVIAATDARVNRGGDLANNIDIVVKRSSDNGETWSAPITVADFGSDGASDPALVVDRFTGDIICVYASHSGLFGSMPANKIRVNVSRSSDNGLTWSTPEDISNQVYPPGWYAVWIASGSMHQTRSGRIIAVAGTRKNSSNTLTNNMIYSEDGGHTWDIVISGPNTNGGDETKIIELDDGTYQMNHRDQYKSGNYRRISTSSDEGATWSTSVQDLELIDPGVNADLIRYTSTKDGFDKNRILFCNPKHANSRENLHVYLSTDETDTWPASNSKQIYAGFTGYSAMTILDDGSIGMIYENGEFESYQITYARFSLDWLSSSTDTFVNTAAPSSASNLAANSFGPDIQLLWTDNSSTETGFEIHRSTTMGSGYTLLARVASDVESYTDTAVANGTTYYYLINAYNAGGSATATNEASATASNDVEVDLETFPLDYQLYARDANDKAIVTIAGTSSNVDSLITRVYRPNGVISRIATDALPNFSFVVEIDAILHDYTIELYSKSHAGIEELVQSATQVTAGDVYVISGQSNAWAVDYDSKYDDEDLPPNAHWVRTIGAMHVYNRTALEPAASNVDWFLARGKAPNSGGGQLVGEGMVGVFGINIEMNLVASENIPIAIINGAGGGGAIVHYQKTTDNDLDVAYGRLQNRIEHSGLKDNIKSIRLESRRA